MKAAYFQSIGGASGDMVLGALIDAGLPVSDLEEAIGRLPIPHVRLRAWRDQRGGLAGTRVEVEIPRDTPHTIEDFIALVDRSTLPDSVREGAIAVLRWLGKAEGEVHGTPSGDLEELGSLDTLVDVVGAVMGLHLLGVERAYAAPLVVGSGVVETRHGRLPIPAPATARLIAEAGAPVAPPPAEATGELTTPTGAAILTTLASFEAPALRVEAIGYGLGSRDTAHAPNALALWLGTVSEEAASLVLLETNIDDTTPELLGYAQERLLAQGALDVWLTPIQMKKGRPGVLVSALAPRHLEPVLVETLLRETSTLGVRTRPVARHEAVREAHEVETALGRLPVKVKRLNGRVVAVSPEYEACRRVALERGIPLQEVYREVEAAAWRDLGARAEDPG